MKTEVSENMGAALIAVRNLNSLAKLGDKDAVVTLRDLGMEVSNSLREISVDPGPGGKACSECAAESEYWPLVVPAVHDIREKFKAMLTPANLGDSLDYRHTPAARSDGGASRPRAMDKGSRVGFADRVLSTMKGIRAAAQIHPTFADYIAHGKGLRDSLSGREEEAGAIHQFESAEAWVSSKIGWEHVWEDAGKLPHWSKRSAGKWRKVCAKWADGLWSQGGWNSYDWPKKLKAEVRDGSKKKPEAQRFRDAVLDWLNYGFDQLIDI